ncbi:MAG TPA: outer membrane lipoprotein carrier protein LolA [Rhizobiaceae bacterium]|nr:outer membrane lipoprotein carrier protein LolA [Rhizobiaceae bacterium]
MKTIFSTRREILGFGLATLGVFATGGALTGVAEAKADDKAQQIADHFSQIQTMTGEFVQFGPKGEQTGGKFFIQRPGKIRFNYEGKTGFRVVADGRSVLIANQQMKTSEIYPLNKTPLKLLLDDRIDLSGNKVKSFKEEGDLTTIQLADKSVFGNAKLTMMFDPNSYELRQWTITDAQGKDTTVMIFNVQQDVKLDSKIFHIDYVSAKKGKSDSEMR